MTYRFTLSPDLSTQHLSGWYVFNTWLQRTLNDKVHLDLYDDFEACRAAARAGHVDLIFANPYDASLLVRDLQFAPIAHPRGRPDEVIIAVPHDSPLTSIEDLRPGVRIATSTDPEVNVIGAIMLEPADLARDDCRMLSCDTYVKVAKQLIRHDADVGFFMADSFREMSALTRKSLRVLLQSHIHVIHHMLLAGPRLAARIALLKDALMALDASDKGVLMHKDLGFDGWQLTEVEEAEFMVDLMETLI